MEENVPIEIAKKLKEKGFPQGTKDYIREKYYVIKSVNAVNGCVKWYCPTISQVLEWLRNEKGIHIGFGYIPRKKWRYVVMYLDDRFYNNPTLSVDGFLKIELAALAGIEYVLDNLL